MLIPTNTLTSLENLSHFAIYTSFTAAELIRMTRGTAVDDGWNMPLVNQILAHLTKVDAIQQQSQDWAGQYFPEKVEEDFKENAGYWGSDAVPVLRCYDFYFLDTSGDCPSWRRRIVVDQYNTGFGNMNTAGQFLFDPKDRCYGKDVAHLMHTQFADGAVVPPFRWHSVRSLGYLLYSVCHLQNRLRCKFTDSVFEQMMWMFRATSEGDAERLEKVDLFHMGVIPDGLSWVPQSERHVLDFNLLNGAMSMHRQLMAESSASYQSDVNDGTSKELTATEVMARVNSSNALMGSMLTKAYAQQTFQYREICRRFATLNHPDCIKFRQLCMADGVDESVLTDSEAWDIMPERVMGVGNKMLEIAQADRLMAVRPLLTPDAQAEVVHMYVEANTDDPLLANKLAPVAGRTVSPAVEKATLAWGTLIDGKPVVLSSAINRPEYISTLIQLLNSDVQSIEQMGGAAEPRRLFGLQNVMQHIEQQMMLIQEDPGQQENLRMFRDALTQIANVLKAFFQQAAEMAQSQQQAGQEGGLTPEAQAKIQAMIITAQSKAEIAAANAEQKRMQKEIAFQQEQQRKDASLLGDAQRKGAQTRADIASLDLKTAADMRRTAVTPQPESEE
jgi:hypothetical protein